MRKYLLLLLGTVVGLTLALLCSGPAPAQGSRSATARLDPHRLVLQLRCCDTCMVNPYTPPCQQISAQSMIISNVMLVARSAADSAWISLLPDTLEFRIVSTGPAKKVTLNWPGIRFDNGKGRVNLAK